MFGACRVRHIYPYPPIQTHAARKAPFAYSTNPVMSPFFDPYGTRRTVTTNVAPQQLNTSAVKNPVQKSRSSSRPKLQVHIGVDFTVGGVTRARPNEGFQAGAVAAETENGVRALSINRRAQHQLSAKVTRVQSAAATQKKKKMRFYASRGVRTDEGW